MKTIIVNPKLDTEDISENVLDYALFTQINRVNLGFNSSREGEAERFESMISKFPDRTDVEDELGRLNLYV